MTAGTVAYLLKGWPRLSEIFIASEVHRLEAAGVPLRLYVIKPPDEAHRHPVVDRVRAHPEYLPATSSLSATPLLRWLLANAGPFVPALRRVARRRPAGLAAAVRAAAAQSLRDRPGGFAAPRKVYVRELFLAVALADRLLAAGDVRHLHAHFAHGATTVAWLASLVTGIPFSFTGHAKDIYSERLNPAGLLRRKLEAAAFAVTCTEANRAHLRAICPGAAVHRVYHGLNADFSRLVAGPAPERVGGDGTLRVLGVGRLVEKKGFDLLVDACADLRAAGVPVEARVVGEDGDHAFEVRRRARAHGLDGQFRLTGPMSQAQLFDQYRRVDVFCLPCRVLSDGDRDGIPNVLVEAMACGVPVVTTGVSGIPELVRDGENGLLVPPDDPAALAAALARLHRDPALAAELGRRGRETVRERFDGDALTVPLAALFAGART
jgi:glycosyltransferase involved in cell wall biosynthesis